MNSNLLSTIKQITTQHGETILADSKRVNAYLSDRAAKEPKPQRMAFVKCLMYGFYAELKNTPADGRIHCKNRLAKKLFDDEGMDVTLAKDTLDLLEAVLFGTTTPEPKPAPIQPEPIPVPPSTSPPLFSTQPQPILQNQPVAAAPKNAWGYFTSVFKKYAVFSGRAQRAEYWWFIMFYYIFYIAAYFIDAIIGTFIFHGVVLLAVFLVFLLPSLGVVIRRMHDTDKSGWFMLVPIYSIVLLFKSGTIGDNRFGPDPKKKVSQIG